MPRRLAGGLDRWPDARTNPWPAQAALSLAIVSYLQGGPVGRLHLGRPAHDRHDGGGDPGGLRQIWFSPAIERRDNWPLVYSLVGTSCGVSRPSGSTPSTGWPRIEHAALCQLMRRLKVSRAWQVVADVFPTIPCTWSPWPRAQGRALRAHLSPCDRLRERPQAGRVPDGAGAVRGHRWPSAAGHAAGLLIWQWWRRGPSPHRHLAFGSLAVLRWER